MKVYEGTQAKEAIPAITRALFDIKVPDAFVGWVRFAERDDLLLVANCLITLARIPKEKA